VNRTFVFITALGAGLMTTAGIAQTPAATPAPAATEPAAPAPVTPQAIPAKIALIAFEQAVFATNEGQKAVQDIQTKYKPKGKRHPARPSAIQSWKRR